MPENNMPFEILYTKTKMEIMAAINKISEKYQFPGQLLVPLIREIYMEADLGNKDMMLAQHELVTPEVLAELKQAKEFYDANHPKLDEESKEG